MELLSIAHISTDTMELLTTKDGQQFILRQHVTNSGSDLSYSVFALDGVVVGAEVTDEPAVDEMMGRYFSVKDELLNGITSDEIDASDIDPYA